MPMQPPIPRPKPDSKELAIADWIQYGLRELDGYMKKQAQFHQWLATHQPEETP